jgi:hypothetical protein
MGRLGGTHFKMIRGKGNLISLNNHTCEFSAIFLFDDERNMAYLYEGDIPDDDYSQKPDITAVAEKEMNCSDVAIYISSFRTYETVGQ